MADIEIYIEKVSEESIVEWISSLFEGLVEIERDDDSVTYSGKRGKSTIPIQIQKNVEDKDLTGVWFNSERTPWKTDRDCARQAFQVFNQKIQCDPGEEFLLPNQFFEISADGERVVEI